MKDFAQSFEQQMWQSALKREENLIEMLRIARKLDHQRSIEYATRTLEEIYKRYPMLRKEIK